MRSSISKGDKVKLLFTNEVGTVVRHLDHETILVNTEGHEIPIFREHLKKIEVKAYEKFTKKPIQSLVELEKVQEATARKIKSMGLNTSLGEDRGLYLAFQPFYKAEGDLNYFLIHLVNDSGTALQFKYQMLLKGKSDFYLNKKIAGGETLIMNTLSFDQLNESPKITIDLERLKPIEDVSNKFNKTLKPKAKMLLKPSVFLGKIDTYGYKVVLFTELPKQKKMVTKSDKPIEIQKTDLETLKRSLFQNKKSKDPVQKVFINAKERIIDLHIEQLVKSHKHLHNSQMLKIQLTHFEKHVETAIKRKEKHMIVIHGLGKGKLKKEIINRLRYYNEVSSFKNEYDHRFGFGATKIFFEY